MTTSNQLRAARALLGLSLAEAAGAANLSISTLKRAEGSGTLHASEEAVSRFTQALEAAGVEFIAENGIGVRLAKGIRD